MKGPAPPVGTSTGWTGSGGWALRTWPKKRATAVGRLCVTVMGQWPPKRRGHILPPPSNATSWPPAQVHEAPRPHWVLLFCR
jgi:hypothetical protein